MSDLFFDNTTGSTDVVSESDNLLYQIKLTGQIEKSYKIPGDRQEGTTIDSYRNFYVADDTGPVFKIKY